MKSKILSAVLIVAVLAMFTACSTNNSSENTGSSASQTAAGGSYDELMSGMAEATDTGDIEITDEMLGKAFLNLGNSYRISNVLKKAAAGEDITIAYLGGSITDGSNASPKATGCYAYLSTKWWKDTFPNITVNYVNAGIGATDSYIGVHRLADDVLSYDPDLLIVEYSVNDTNFWNKETYESILVEALNYESEPAVIALLLTAQNSNFASTHAPVAFKYEVPIISYSALINTSGFLSWSDVGDTDGVHPKNEGHSVIAYLLTTYYRQMLTEIESADTSYSVPTSSITSVRYVGADMYYASEIANEVENYTSEGFESVAGPGFMKGENTMLATTSAGKISFTLTAKSFGIIYYQIKSSSDEYCDYSVYVDGELKGTMDSANATTWGNNASYTEFFCDSEAATHTIEIMPADDASGTDFSIISFCINK